MNKKIIAAVTFSLIGLSFAQAMEMKNNDIMKKDTAGSMMNTTMQDSASMYDSVMSSSKKADISKLQMMLVAKGYLVMPEGAAYGHYGSLTKAAHKKYKSSMMMKASSGDSMMKATSSMMMSH